MNFVMNIDGQNYEFKVANINPVTLSEMIQRSKYDRSIFLSLVVEEPQLTAHEWYTQVPINIINEIMEKISELGAIDYYV